jgi:hypothetical protein
VWQKLQAGEVANVDDYADEGGPLPPADPRKPGEWQNSRRRLAPRFVEDLLLREPYRNELHRKGARIQGAWFNDQIDLEWAELARQIWLHRCRFEKSVLLTGLRTPHIVSFDSSAFAADLRLELAQIRAPLSVTGTNVARTLNMDSADIGQSLFIRRAEFNNVVMNSAKIAGQVSLIGTKVAGTLEMDSTAIGQSLLMRSDNRESGRRAEFNEVVLNGAKVGGQISLIAAKVASALKMDSIKVGRNLFMRSDSTVSAEFKDVEIRNAKIGGQVSLIGAKVVGTLDMDSVDIGGSLLMKSDRSVSEQRAELNDVDLRSAKVGGQVSLVGAKVAGTVNMYAAEIGESVFMRSDPSMSEHRAEFDSGVSLIFAEIGGSLDVQGAVLSSLDLTGTKIRADLRLALRSWPPQWRSGGRLVVRNTSVDAIQDTEDDGVWPESLVLDGFTYRRFGGLGVGAEARVARRGADWFVRWLAKDEPYAPQPAHSAPRCCGRWGTRRSQTGCSTKSASVSKPGGRLGATATSPGLLGWSCSSGSSAMATVSGCSGIRSPAS